VFNVLKILLAITRGDDETTIQRLIFMAMMSDVMKQFYHSVREIRIVAYRIMYNLCLAKTESVKEAIGSRESFIEIVQNF
jgi:hypothetical protein